MTTEKPTMQSLGFETPLEAVLSGQFELLIPRKKDSEEGDVHKAFVRNAVLMGVGAAKQTPLVSEKATAQQAGEIIQHHCVIAGKHGSLLHYHTRAFPLPPSNQRRRDE